MTVTHTGVHLPGWFPLHWFGSGLIAPHGLPDPTTPFTVILPDTYVTRLHLTPGGTRHQLVGGALRCSLPLLLVLPYLSSIYPHGSQCPYPTAGFPTALLLPILGSQFCTGWRTTGYGYTFEEEERLITCSYCTTLPVPQLGSCDPTCPGRLRPAQVVGWQQRWLWCSYLTARWLCLPAAKTGLIVAAAAKSNEKRITVPVDWIVDYNAFCYYVPNGAARCYAAARALDTLTDGGDRAAGSLRCRILPLKRNIRRCCLLPPALTPNPLVPGTLLLRTYPLPYLPWTCVCSTRSLAAATLPALLLLLV